MDKGFEDLWKNRNSLHEKDQTDLYNCIIKIASKSSNLNKNKFTEDERDMLLQDFYVEKILSSLELGRAISCSKYDSVNPLYIITMMNQFIVSYFRSETKKITFENHPIEQDSVKVTNISWQEIEEGYNEQLQIKGLIDNHNSISHQSDTTNNESKETLNHAIEFLTNSESWVRLLIANQCSDKPLSDLTAHYEMKSAHAKAAKLGLLHKGSYYQGTEKIDDYHTTTLIGRWLIEIYGNEILPLDRDFLRIILKILCEAAFITMQRGKKDN